MTSNLRKRKRPKRDFTRQQSLGLLVFLTFPAVCFANAGIGFFIVVVPLIVVTLPVVVIIEAIYMRYRLALTWRRSFCTSFLANIVSTLLGAAIGLGVDLVLISLTGSSGFEPTKIVASIALVPMFYLTIRTEYTIWRWRNQSLVERDLARSILIAHLISYALLLSCVWAHRFFLYEATLPVRMRLIHQLEALRPAQQAFSEFAAQHQRLPKKGELEEIKLDETGRLSVTLNEAVFPKGTRMWFTATLQKDFSVHWECQMQAPEAQVLDRAYALSQCPPSL